MHCNNYRLISLLSIFNKLLEKLVFNRISCFIVKHTILYNKQFSFRAKHSTLHAILSITDQIQTAVENGYYLCGIFLDLSKAFDTVNHFILFQKLEHYGFRGIVYDWFESYLYNRKQFVSIGGVSSGLLDVTCGVPTRFCSWPSTFSFIY
jgi:hypothetical protein